MDDNGRPNHIEDYLARLHTGQWFGWSDSKNKVYANLIIHNDSKDKPSESNCTNGLKSLQDAWDLEHNSYKSNRKSAYGDIGEQLDEIYKDIDAWKARIKSIKDANPKE